MPPPHMICHLYESPSKLNANPASEHTECKNSNAKKPAILMVLGRGVSGGTHACIGGQGIFQGVPPRHPGSQHIVLLVQRLPQRAGRHALCYACIEQLT